MIGHADIALVGLGSAALQFAKLAHTHPAYSNKQIVFIDPTPRSSKSWCFWHKGPHSMDDFVSHVWQNLHFGYGNFEKTQRSAPYTYRHISSERMYDWFFNELLPSKPLWRFERKSISEVKYEDKGILLVGDDFKIYANYVLDSRLAQDDFHLPLTWQHFRGFTIKANTEVFDLNTATFMDFSLTSGQKNPSFVYVLPFSSTEALIETTVFSSHIWRSEQYDTITREYISAKWPSIGYEITEVETGRIPMGFLKNNESKNPRHVKIGGAGGCIKPTTGYAFQRISKSINRLVEELYLGEIDTIRKPRRFRFYDSLLLDIIQKEPKKIEHIMAHLFRKNSIPSVLEFLDEESNLVKEARIFSSLPLKPFLKALNRSIFK